MSARDVLHQGGEVLNARSGAYGPAASAIAAIAARWSITLGRPVTPEQVVLCMIDLKLARLARDPGYRDGVIDVIGSPRSCRRSANDGNALCAEGLWRHAPLARAGPAGRLARASLLAVSVDDERLAWRERELVRQLGERLSGEHDPTKEA